MVDPRNFPELRNEFTHMMEKIPCASILVRIKRAAVDQDGTVLSAKTVPQNEWKDRGVVVPPPEYRDIAYSTLYCPVSDLEMQMFEGRAERIEEPLRKVGE